MRQHTHTHTHESSQKPQLPFMVCDILYLMLRSLKCRFQSARLIQLLACALRRRGVVWRVDYILVKGGLWQAFEGVCSGEDGQGSVDAGRPIVRLLQGLRYEMTAAQPRLWQGDQEEKTGSSSVLTGPKGWSQVWASRVPREGEGLPCTADASLALSRPHYATLPPWGGHLEPVWPSGPRFTLPLPIQLLGS